MVSYVSVPPETIMSATLVDVYRTTPAKLLNAQITDFDEDQWTDLARDICNEDWNVAYDLRVVAHILSLIGEKQVWENNTFAEHFLYTAIFQNDYQTVDFILSHFEHVRTNGGRMAGAETSYLLAAVDYINDKNNQCYMILDCLLKHFNDPGEALMLAVSWGKTEVVQKLLPHSNPLHQWCLPYRWAQVYNMHEIEQILEPVSDKVHALYGYSIETWKEPNDFHIAQKREMTLRGKIQSNEFDEHLAQLYTTGLQRTLEDADLHHLKMVDLYVLAMLWNTNVAANAKTALEQVRLFDDHLVHTLVKHFGSLPDVIFPRISEKAKEKVLSNCALDNNRALANSVFAYGVNTQNVYESLSNSSAFLKLRHLSAVAKTVELRQHAADVLQQWINEWQAQTIEKELKGLGVVVTHSKL